MKFTWSMLRSIGSSRLARLTVFVPIVGYLLIFNNQISQMWTLIPAFEGDAATNLKIGGTLARITYLYIGLSLVGFASVVFVIWCPREIQDNAGEHEFIAKELDIITEARFSRKKARLQELKSSTSAILKAEIQEVAVIHLSDTVGIENAVSSDLRRSGLKWSDWHERNKRHLSNITSLEYRVLNESRRFFRNASMFLYALGFSFVSISSIEVLYKAIAIAISTPLWAFS